MLGGLVLAACSSGPGSTSTTTTSHSHSTSTSASNSNSSTTTTSLATTTTSAAPLNEMATAAVKAALTGVYVSHSGLPADQVQGTVPGSVYYSFYPPTNTYWAYAEFEPVPNADMNTQVAMQDDGCCGIFAMTPGSSWVFVKGGYGPLCNTPVPQAVLELWGKAPTAADCQSSTPTTAGG
jgi:hypothetical protein